MPARPAPAPFARTLSALPDAVTAGAFGLAWIHPFAFGPDTVKILLLVMLLEFLLVHASGFFAGIACTDLISERRGPRIAALCALSLLYLLFVAAFAHGFDAPWLYLGFLWLLGGKIAWVIANPRPSEREMSRQMLAWALSVLLYLAGVALTVTTPLPRLGLDAATVAVLGLGAGGVWQEQPHTVLAFGLFYFGLLAMIKFLFPPRRDTATAHADDAETPRRPPVVTD